MVRAQRHFLKISINQIAAHDQRRTHRRRAGSFQEAPVGTAKPKRTGEGVVRAAGQRQFAIAIAAQAARAADAAVQGQLVGQAVGIFKLHARVARQRDAADPRAHVARVDRVVRGMPVQCEGLVGEGRAVEQQHAGGFHFRAGGGRARASVVKAFQEAILDQRESGVVVRAVQRERAGASLRERTAAVQRTEGIELRARVGVEKVRAGSEHAWTIQGGHIAVGAIGQAAIEREAAVKTHDPAAAELHAAEGFRRPIVQRQHAGAAEPGQRAGAADHAAECEVVALAGSFRAEDAAVAIQRHRPGPSIGAGVEQHHVRPAIQRQRLLTDGERLNAQLAVRVHDRS